MPIVKVDGVYALHFAFHELVDGYGLYRGHEQGARRQVRHTRTLSIFFALKTFCKTLKFAMNSYSCFAFILTRIIGTSPGKAGYWHVSTIEDGELWSESGTVSVP